MTNQNRLNEDKLPSKFYVRFSTKIVREIDAIETFNQNNYDGLSQWYDYLEGLKNYISNPAIAWDYTNRHIKFPNGTRFIRDFNYNVGYTVKINKKTNLPYVYIFMIDLKAGEFELKVPPSLKLRENKQIKLNKVILPIQLTESDLRKMVEKSVKMALQHERNRRLEEAIGKSLHHIINEHIRKTVRT